MTATESTDKNRDDLERDVEEGGNLALILSVLSLLFSHHGLWYFNLTRLQFLFHLCTYDLN